MGLQKKTIDALGGLTSTRVSREELTLEVIEGPHSGLSMELDKEILRIGREDWCDISLSDDPWVSTIHCECLFEEKGLRVQDMRSRNGIRLNDVHVYDALFLPGMRLQVGQSVLTLRSNQQQREVSIPFHDSTETLIGQSLAMRKIFSFLPRLGQRKVTTLLAGETGTGKTSVAKALHQNTHGVESKAPFVVVNCGALPENLINAALFGHEKGSFTGADKRHIGFFEQANGGTLFLDEIAELPLELQPKLLDVLERKMVRRVGSEKEHPVDFHLVTATHKDLEKECQAGRFREDLFFRLSVMTLTLPPLRERREDIPLLAEAILQELSPNETLYVSSQAMEKLSGHVWPGNIRELRNTLERSTLFLDGNTLEAENVELASQGTRPQQHFKHGEGLRQSSATAMGYGEQQGDVSDEQVDLMREFLPPLPLSGNDPIISLKDLLQHAERFYIAQALKEVEQNAPEAAKLLAMSESWLYSRIKLYGFKSKRKV